MKENAEGTQSARRGFALETLGELVCARPSDATERIHGFPK